MPWTLDLTGGRFAFESVEPHADCWGTVTTASGPNYAGGALVGIQQITDPATGRQLWSEMVGRSGSYYLRRPSPEHSTRNGDGTVYYRFRVHECGCYAAFICDPSSPVWDNIRCVGFRFTLASDGHPVVERIDDVTQRDVLVVGPNIIRVGAVSEHVRQEAERARFRYIFEPDRPQE